MPHCQEALNFGGIIEKGRIGLAVFVSSLALGGAGLAKAENSQAGYLSKQPVYGLSGLALTDKKLNITKQPGWDLIASPESPYHTEEVRALVRPGEPVEAARIIEAHIKYAKDFLNYKPGRDKEAPVVVSLSTNNTNVTAVNAGKDVCDRYKPNTHKRNKLFNANTCTAKTEQILKTNLPKLMREFPQVIYWTAENEPEDAGQPTNASAGGEKLAVRMWLIADKIARSFKKNRIIIAGEFWNFPSQYERNYEKDLAFYNRTYHVPKPRAQALHSYNDAVCDRETNTQAFINDLEKDGLEKSIENGDGLWETEIGVQLNTTNTCSNAQGLANQAKQSTSTISAYKLKSMTQNQIDSANTVLNIYKADTKIKFHIFYYDPEPGSPYCWQGGPWDTGIWAPNGLTKNGQISANGEGLPGTPRPAFYVLTHQPLPNVLRNPRPGPTADYAALTLIPPSNWAPKRVSSTTTKPGVSCHYGSPLPR